MKDTIELDADALQDAHGLYDRLRTEAPVCPVILEGGVRAWLVTRYAEALPLLNDPRLIKDASRALARFAPGRPQPYAGPMLKNMLGSDPPAHTRLRRLVVKAFTSRAVERMQPRVEAVADELLDGIDLGRAAAPVDLIANYAELLPIRVISDLLGMPADYAIRFRSASRPIISIATRAVKEASERDTMAILDDLIEYKRREPGDDLLTSLINVSTDGDRLSHDELLAMCFLLTAAGYETTTHLIANGLLAFLNNPSQMTAVRDDPTLIPNAVEEVLRFDGPANVTTPRYTTAEITVGDIVIPCDEVVLIALLSANRDGDRFDDADHFDVARAPRGHLGFGYGVHHCLGARLARMEGATAIRQLLDRYDHIALDRTDPLRSNANMLIHGVATLPVWLRKGAA
jgi:cytochrome P450